MKYTTTFIAAFGLANAAIIPSVEQTRDNNSGSELVQRGPKGGGGGGGGKPPSNKPGVNFEIDPLAPLNVLPWVAPPPGGEAPPPQKREPVMWTTEPKLVQRNPKGSGGGGGKPPSNKPGVNFEIDPLAPLNVLPWVAPPPGGEAPPPQKREPIMLTPETADMFNGPNLPFGLQPPQKRDIEAAYNELAARHPEAEPIIRPIVDLVSGIFGV
ncbi:hypothetical protein MFIFM68171_05516 [Madurella fahalii]|uniref:Uncharacterized protein n=1 Tax=Madurella fahalii TaxID=1157608 RepID=A0ABQ0GC21_9PEZI